MRDDSDCQASSNTVGSADIQPSLSLDTILEVLANQRRRFALYTLADSPDGVVALETLIEDVVTLEAGLTNEALRRDRYIETAADLYHWHLDVLADVGIVTYDKRRKSIRYRSEPLLETWLDQVRRSELSKQV